MKHTLLALAAVLAPLCAAQAASIENPGPHKVLKAQVACQNLMDADELHGTYISKDMIRRERMWSELGAPENDARRRLCIMLPAGTTVTVEKRQPGYECVNVKGRPASHCFHTATISKTPSHRTPVYDGGVIFID